MERSILLVLIAMLALTIGLNGSASASGSADALAAAKKGKSKSCKKKGKAKGKASAAASAKKKGKGKGCKKQGKAKGKEQPKATPNPGGGGETPATPGASWPPADGTYTDAANGITLTLKSGATSAEQRFSGGHGTCVLLLVTTNPAPTSVTASSLTTTGEASNSGSINFFMKSTMVVTPGLGYEATIDSKLSGDAVTPCDKPGVVFKGTLVKTS